ncbi:hypothetical protein WN943_027441 [Citrus x changshan-huyou]
MAESSQTSWALSNHHRQFVIGGSITRKYLTVMRVLCVFSFVCDAVDSWCARKFNQGQVHTLGAYVTESVRWTGPKQELTPSAINPCPLPKLPLSQHWFFRLLATEL